MAAARLRRALAVLVFSVATGHAAEGAPANGFAFAQLEHAGQWDPYPDQWPALASMLERTTSVSAWPERRTLGAGAPELFDTAFLVMAGRADPRLSDADVARLRDYLGAGGFLFIDHSAASAAGPFADAVKALPARFFGDASWQKIPREHALYRAFFLLKRAAGRRRASDDLWGLWLGDRLVAVYSENDLLGAVARDRMGQPLLPCEPDGEAQRIESRKLFINVAVFAMTGTYKTDAVHQPFLEKKVRP